MSVPMVDVWKVVVTVPSLCVRVGMHMRPCATPFKAMGVLVVHIMRMGVFVFEGFVVMFVFVLFCQMQPDANSH